MAALRCLAASTFICGLAGEVARTGTDSEPEGWADYRTRLVKLAAEPLVSKLMSERVLEEVGSNETRCDNVLLAIDWAILHMHRQFSLIRKTAHIDQDNLIAHTVDKGIPAKEFFMSPGFRKMLDPAITLHRLATQTVEFITTIALLQGERCLTPDLRVKLMGTVMTLAEASKQAHMLQFAISFKGIYSFWDVSTDVNRHMSPIWDVISSIARVAESLGAVRLMIAKYKEIGEDTWQLMAGPPDWEDKSTGAFSEMHFMQRQFMDAWHLDYGLVTSLTRLWVPPVGGWSLDAGCHTSIADFGAGGGHYCKFLNQTGEYCCSAYDGSEHAPELTDNKVLTRRLNEPFDLGRVFDWVMCLEVAEHIPAASEDVLLSNLRRHARRGLVLSWSEEEGGPHINARPWHEVQKAVEAVGFVLDRTASAGLRPQVPWMRGAVHVFRIHDSAE